MKVYLRSSEDSYSPKQTDLYLTITQKLYSNKLKGEFKEIFPPHDKVADIIFVGHYDKKKLVQISADLTIDGDTKFYSNVLEKVSSAQKHRENYDQMILFESDDELQKLLDNTLGLQEVFTKIKDQLS